MAHFIYEYSANLPAAEVDLQRLMGKMHTAARATGSIAGSASTS